MGADPSIQLVEEIERLKDALAKAEASLNPPAAPAARYHREDYPAEEWFDVAVRLSELYHSEVNRRLYWHEDAMEAREINRRYYVLAHALESLTPGGAEYHNDPDKCLAWIKEQLAGASKDGERIQSGGEE